MSVVIVGSTALDSIKTPTRQNPRLLGGSGTHAAVAASFFAPVRLVGVVGDDFPERYVAFLRKKGIDLEGLEFLPGKTFHWAGEYEVNMNVRRTVATELGVLADYEPRLPAACRRSPYVLLANNAPSLQHHVLDQIKHPRLAVADTMDLWIRTALKDLLRLLRRIDIFVLNDSEACLLTGETQVLTALKKIHHFGPPYVVVKKGEHGSVVSGPDGLFLAPAYPLDQVEDPTGAGDSFVGAMLGYLARQGGPVRKHLRSAILHGSVVASFCCEGFGLTRTARVTPAAIRQRVRALERMIRV